MSSSSEIVTTARVAPGGQATVCLGTDANSYPVKASPLTTPPPTARVSQAPGGNTTICLGGAFDVVSSTSSKPVGGATAICLGTDGVPSPFEHRNKEKEVVVSTPDANPRFPQAPGGNESVPVDEATQSSRREGPPVGGNASISLGSESEQARFARVNAEVLGETPAALQRFSQAPGGTSTVQFYGGAVDAISARGPVGGAQTFVLGGEAEAEEAPVTARRAIGGTDSVVLGSEAPSLAFAERQQEKEALASLAAPDAAVRFSQAPGGDSTVCLGGPFEEHRPHTGRAVGGHDSIIFGADAGDDKTSVSAASVPVGGATTIVLGTDEATPYQRSSAYSASLASTPEPIRHITQAPGGNSTIKFGEEYVPELPSARQSGPQATVCLGSDDASAFYREREQQKMAGVVTPDAPARFTQAPGGKSSVILGGAEQEPLSSSRGAVGGETTVILGSDGGAWKEYEEQHHRVVATPEPAPRFSQAPGGRETLDATPTTSELSSARGPVGGADAVVLGIDDSKKDFDERHAIRSTPVKTPDAAPRFQQTPGGNSTVSLGGVPPPLPQFSPDRQPPGGSGEAFKQALGGGYPHDICDRASLESGSHSERLSTRVRYAPGGTSTLVLGAEGSPLKEAVSSNAFANASNPNAGNVLTERPSTHLNQAPGGNSTFVLGGNYPDDVAEKKASDVPIGHRPERRIQQAPGGTSSLVLGEAIEKPTISTKKHVEEACDENVNTTNV